MRQGSSSKPKTKTGSAAGCSEMEQCSSSDGRVWHSRFSLVFSKFAFRNTGIVEQAYPVWHSPTPDSLSKAEGDGIRDDF
jgi:hypothetical protein